MNGERQGTGLGHDGLPDNVLKFSLSAMTGAYTALGLQTQPVISPLGGICSVKMEQN